jgi:thiol-disulfide isomerase/thioredoxin
MMLGIISMVALIGTLGSQGTPATPATPAAKQTSSAAAQAPTVAPKDADILIKDALADAKKSGRVVFVRFTATWCGWCRLMEKTLDEPEVRERFDKQFVVVTLDVLEQGPKKPFENPNGEKWLNSLGGAGGGIPFFATLDAKGKKLIDSNLMPTGQNKNLGCPATDEEVKLFGDYLDKSGKKLSASDKQFILGRFKANAPKI